MTSALTPKEAASIIGCSAAHVRWLIRHGRIEFKKKKLEHQPSGFMYFIPAKEARRIRDNDPRARISRGKTKT